MVMWKYFKRLQAKTLPDIYFIDSVVSLTENASWLGNGTIHFLAQYYQWHGCCLPPKAVPSLLLLLLHVLLLLLVQLVPLVEHLLEEGDKALIAV